MTQILIGIEKRNPNWASLDAANVADGHYARKARPELVVKAEKVEAYYKAQIDEAYDEAERNITNPWDKLVTIPHGQAVDALETIKRGESGALECECAPDGSTTCRLCKAQAYVRYQYGRLFEEDN